MQIVFIAGLSHSGSTLLDLMLNAHPQVLSVGELKKLGRFTRPGQPKSQYACTCGAPSLWDCNFWSRVNASTTKAIGKTIAELNVEDYGQEVSFQKDNIALFNAISAISGKNVIVDSSKVFQRLALLLKNEPLEVFPVFLLRNPKGQVYSMMRKGQSDVRELARQYVRRNQEIYSLIKDRPHAVVHYEQLVATPEQTLGKLMGAIGLFFNPVQLRWARAERHNVGGNGMRRRDASELRLDDAWRQGLSISQKIIIDLRTLSGRYTALKYAG